jgi:nitrogen regulatory protein PII
MKEVKTFIHRNRISDVVYALQNADFRNLSISDVKCTLKALTNAEQEYSIEFGNKIITEVKIEVVCNSTELQKCIRIIRENAQTDQVNGGLIYVSDISEVFPINVTGED